MESDATTTTDDLSPIPTGWWSIGAAIVGFIALAGSVVQTATSWSDDDKVAVELGAFDRFAAFASTIGSAALALLLVALFVDRTSTRRWALLGAAAYVLSFVFRAVIEQRLYSNFNG